MRGKGQTACEVVVEFGITPACAGKRVQIPEYLGGGRDHPRVCGEKIRAIFKMAFSLGSPPRMRGKVKVHCCGVLDVRITPAYAGKRHWHCRKCRKKRDHPRVCGEKQFLSSSPLFVVGSPPRMRGKVQEGRENIDRTRITPAYAGKRTTITPLFVHSVGSPPRMRGKD